MTRSWLVVVAIAATMVACSTDPRLAELEAENAGLRQRIVALEDAEAGATTSTTPTTAAATGTEVDVVEIIDGDTLSVRVGGRVEPVRLIGIDAPERDECLAEAATDRLAELVGSGSVTLEKDVSDRDRFDRLLRYVWVGEVLVNRELVADGLAIARRYPPDLAHTETLETAQADAREARRGLWADDACGPAATGASIRIGHIRYDADGDDNQNLNDEWVEFVNDGDADLDLTGWGVKDESATHRYRFPDGFVLAPGATVRLHTGCGTDTAASLYWCNRGSAVWNNSGDTVFVLDPNGNVVVFETYAGRR